MLYLLFIDSLFSIFIFLFIISLFILPIIKIFINYFKDIIIKLFYINFSFLFINILYLNIFSNNFNLKYNQLYNKDIIIYNNYTKYNCKLENHYYYTFFRLKHFLYLKILKKNNIYFIITIDDFINIKKNNKYYHILMFSLLKRYSKNLNNLDHYLLNYIKDFLY